MQNLESLSCDPSVKAADRAKVNGYLRKWKTTKVFVYSCQPSATLSPAFQEADIDAVAASPAVAKAKCQLTLLMEKEPEKIATVKHYLTKVQEDTYRGLKIASFYCALDEVRKRASFYVERVRSAMEDHLEGVEDLSGVARILSCEPVE